MVGRRKVPSANLVFPWSVLGVLKINLIVGATALLGLDVGALKPVVLGVHVDVEGLLECPAPMPDVPESALAIVQLNIMAVAGRHRSGLEDGGVDAGCLLRQDVVLPSWIMYLAPWVVGRIWVPKYSSI